MGNPGRAYGSVQLQLPGERPQTPLRFDFGHGTNNQAEYRALIEGLNALRRSIEQRNLDPAAAEVEVRGDSRLVINQLAGNWKIKNPKLRALHDRATELASGFSSVVYLQARRASIVRALGH